LGTVLEHIPLAWNRAGAGIRSKARQDFAVSLFLIIGEPVVMMMKLPGRRAVWTNDRVSIHHNAKAVKPETPQALPAPARQSAAGRVISGGVRGRAESFSLYEVV